MEARRGVPGFHSARGSSEKTAICLSFPMCHLASSPEDELSKQDSDLTPIKYIFYCLFVYLVASSNHLEINLLSFLFLYLSDKESQSSRRQRLKGTWGVY